MSLFAFVWDSCRVSSCPQQTQPGGRSQQCQEPARECSTQAGLQHPSEEWIPLFSTQEEKHDTPHNIQEIHSIILSTIFHSPSCFSSRTRFPAPAR